MHSKQFRFCILFLTYLFFACIPAALLAQESDDEPENIDSTQNKVLPPFPDSIYKFNVKIPVAKRAGLYSALLPGLGQVYNKQYWKLGVVLAAGGAVTGFLIYNSKQYNTYQEAYLGRIDNDPTTTDTFTNYQTSDIDLLRKTYRKYVEYTVIAGTICYLINILDAFTSAHLKTFDMNKNISMRASPYFDNKQQFGIRISIAKK